jgi:hypothetical protein
MDLGYKKVEKCFQFLRNDWEQMGEITRKVVVSPLHFVAYEG